MVISTKILLLFPAAKVCQIFISLKIFFKIFIVLQSFKNQQITNIKSLFNVFMSKENKFHGIDFTPTARKELSSQKITSAYRFIYFFS